MLNNSIIEAQNIYKSFDQLEVLKDISLSVTLGEIVCLIGASGSGKSTLLRCLNFLEIPNRGEVYLDGKKTLYQQQEQLVDHRRQVGMVFQHFNLFPHLSVIENITEAPIRVLKKSKEQAISEALAILEKVELLDKKNEYPARLSGGQQQRVAIARALAMNPKVLLFDEPTSALDPETIGSVLKVIRRLAKDGMTMIIVTHEIAFAAAIAHRICFLHEGEIIEQGSPNEIIQQPKHERTKEFLKNITRGSYE
jgi:polar amino acid transport system ATP-binding protein